MKTNFTKLLSVCFFLLLGYGVMAQDIRSVGETHAYTVTPENGSNTFAWTVSGSQGSDWAITAGALDQASVTINWQKPGTYNLSFTETEAHGGLNCSTRKTATVTVNADFDVVIADAAIALNCATPAATTDVTFVLTKTNGDNDWTFDYTTVGLGTELTGNDVAASGGTHNLVISLNNVSDGSDQTFKVQISDVKDSFGNLTVSGDEETSNVTIYGLPNTGNITF
ncbi:hypothetical protein [Ancylomarina longa]|uniref:PKD domain-containing protein n=1 Tax=Ancylomarina longa TaxID=2487017 RepID=A0A434AVI4_9BACT|nr:hypothetical protein [Ancylomarina longa]RUT78478.1 hypothetical protein DLK05_07840 [Ancylomarina longa]